MSQGGYLAPRLRLCKCYANHAGRYTVPPLLASSMGWIFAFLSWSGACISCSRSAREWLDRYAGTQWRGTRTAASWCDLLVLLKVTSDGSRPCLPLVSHLAWGTRLPRLCLEAIPRAQPALLPSPGGLRVCICLGLAALPMSACPASCSAPGDPSEGLWAARCGDRWGADPGGGGAGVQPPS